MRIIFIFNSIPYGIYHLVILLSNFSLGLKDHIVILQHELYGFVATGSKGYSTL